MTELSVIQNFIPSMSDMAIDKVRYLEDVSLLRQQVDISTQHVIHGGMYARTIMIPAGVLLTGVLIKIATILIVNGNVIAYVGDKTIELNGYNVLQASAHRKQAFVAKTDTYLTMIFPSDAISIKEAEEEFTDESSVLISRNNDAENHVTITGE